MAVATTYETALDNIRASILAFDYVTARIDIVIAQTFASALPDYTIANRGITRASAFAQLKEISAQIPMLEATAATRTTPFSRTRVTGMGRW